jgi:hypothetical protein
MGNIKNSFLYINNNQELQLGSSLSSRYANRNENTDNAEDKPKKIAFIRKMHSQSIEHGLEDFKAAIEKDDFRQLREKLTPESSRPLQLSSYNKLRHRYRLEALILQEVINKNKPKIALDIIKELPMTEKLIGSFVKSALKAENFDILKALLIKSPQHVKQVFKMFENEQIKSFTDQEKLTSEIENSKPQAIDGLENPAKDFERESFEHNKYCKPALLRDNILVFPHPNEAKFLPKEIFQNVSKGDNLSLSNTLKYIKPDDADLLALAARQDNDCALRLLINKNPKILDNFLKKVLPNYQTKQDLVEHMPAGSHIIHDNQNLKYKLPLEHSFQYEALIRLDSLTAAADKLSPFKEDSKEFQTEKLLLNKTLTSLFDKKDSLLDLEDYLNSQKHSLKTLERKGRKFIKDLEVLKKSYSKINQVLLEIATHNDKKLPAYKLLDEPNCAHQVALENLYSLRYDSTAKKLLEFDDVLLAYQENLLDSQDGYNPQNHLSPDIENYLKTISSQDQKVNELSLIDTSNSYNLKARYYDDASMQDLIKKIMFKGDSGELTALFNEGESFKKALKSKVLSKNLMSELKNETTPEQSFIFKVIDAYMYSTRDLNFLKKTLAEFPDLMNFQDPQTGTSVLSKIVNKSFILSTDAKPTLQGLKLALIKNSLSDLNLKNKQSNDALDTFLNRVAIELSLKNNEKKNLLQQHIINLGTEPTGNYNTEIKAEERQLIEAFVQFQDLNNSSLKDSLHYELNGTHKKASDSKFKSLAGSLSKPISANSIKTKDNNKLHKLFYQLAIKQHNEVIDIRQLISELMQHDAFKNQIIEENSVGDRPLMTFARTASNKQSLDNMLQVFKQSGVNLNLAFKNFDGFKDIFYSDLTGAGLRRTSVTQNRQINLFPNQEALDKYKNEYF